ncbi:MAG TPA: DUF4976 domain-containing protein [Candidatus Hydrogenedentes bacterium]|nr:DUF4976 domain-containing protein [Candidatus Hydrogenedentota bacterium]
MSNATQKNVLWITADEFRPDFLGAAGNPIIQTPNLDMLARDGVLVNNAFCQASPCAPSRMCMHTGRYMCSTGVVDNMTPLAEAEDNIGMHLKNHGFNPVILGYNDYARDPRILPEDDPCRTSLSYDFFLPGFEVALKHEYDSPEWYAWLRGQGYSPEQCNRDFMYTHAIPPSGRGKHLPLHYPARYKAEHSEAQFLTMKAVDCLRSRKGTSWVMSLNYIKPHGPYICPSPYHALYDPADMPEPLRRPGEMANNHPYMSRCRSDWAQTELRKESDWRELRACYCGMITELDACLGRLFEYLKQSGEWDNTLILFTSDHGTYLGDHYLAGKPHFYDAACRVPLIIRDPSREADPTRGKKLDGFVETLDLAPTVCQYLGAPAHERFQGNSILDAVRGSGNLKEEIFYEFYYYNLLKEQNGCSPEACRLWTVRNDRFKYVQFGEADMPSQLFDLRNDPGEFINLAEDPGHGSVVADCCQRLIRWRMRHEDYRMEEWARQYR